MTWVKAQGGVPSPCMQKITIEFIEVNGYNVNWSDLLPIIRIHRRRCVMVQWDTPMKPAELAENRLVDAILDRTFPVNSVLPPERELAEMLGVTRPTLREVLQRLSRDGWLEIHHGKSTRVRDYWREGNLTILAQITRSHKKAYPSFVVDLLQIRLLMAPAYTRLAFENALPEVTAFLNTLQTLPDELDAYVENDLKLHLLFTQLSGNPIFTLIFNGFGDLYRKMGQLYFANPAARDHSKKFYIDLLNAAQANDPAQAEEITRQVMLDSIHFWEIAESQSAQ
jgi:GntR family transcriptional regulator, negative regulator for fad regulon and positive regulator of fabA